MEKTLRDELAMSMPMDAMPKIQDVKILLEIAEKIGTSVNPQDDLSLLNFTLKYQAWFRYNYADAMLEMRGKSNNP